MPDIEIPFPPCVIEGPAVSIFDNNETGCLYKGESDDNFIPYNGGETK